MVAEDRASLDQRHSSRHSIRSPLTRIITMTLFLGRVVIAALIIAGIFAFAKFFNDAAAAKKGNINVG
ncbi:putative membrane protein [Rhizobium phage Pasto]|uniref:Putative membrane protein n=1 Tax=Rhizobium phage Pasto TaxID=2767575 RepID=A0A7S6R6W6_9CAUD|nr:putative membrane protein [Rhizobium phage Pasto]